MKNAKNDLHELIKNIGYFEETISFSVHDQAGTFAARAEFTTKDGRSIHGSGSGSTKKAAEIAAAKNMLDAIYATYEDLLIDWEEAKAEAQAGDSLIKLCAYLSEDFNSVEEKSRWLQHMESDEHLARLFDKLKAQGHPSVVFFGNNLGAKKKATWMEAMIWRKFGKNIISNAADRAFRDLISFLNH